jgi:hypothetical protein
VLALNIESMFRVEMLKILLQQYLPGSDICAAAKKHRYSITSSASASIRSAAG